MQHDSTFGSGVSQRDNTLIISNAQDDDQGYYQCQGLVEGVPIENIFVYVEIESKKNYILAEYPLHICRLAV